MSEKILSRANRLAGSASQYCLKEVLATAHALITMGYGATFVFTSGSFTRTHTYDIALRWAAASTWGVTFMILGSLLCSVLFVNKQQAMWPGAALTIVYGSLTFANLFSLSEGGIPATIWLHALATTISAIVTVACAYHQEPVTSKTITVVQTTAVS